MANGRGQNEEADRDYLPIGPMQRGRTELRRISGPDAFKSIKLEAPVRGRGRRRGRGLQRDILRIPHSRPRLGGRGLCGWSFNLICWVGGVCFVLTTLRAKAKYLQTPAEPD